MSPFKRGDRVRILFGRKNRTGTIVTGQVDPRGRPIEEGCERVRSDNALHPETIHRQYLELIKEEATN